MGIIENLSLVKREFFKSIGIYTDAMIPDSFNERIIHLNSVISESEKFCLEDYNVCYQSESFFSIKDLVGTDHDRYAGKTWLEAFMDLDRGDENLKLYFNNPNYYQELALKGETDLGLASKDGKYYILGRAGGGNNRLIIMKIKYLALVNKRNLDKSILDKEFTFLANIRYVPSKDTADNIFYLIFPNGGYKTSGFYVLNKSNNPNEELYDIVSNYPFTTQVVASYVLGKDIGLVELQTENRLKK